MNEMIDTHCHIHDSEFDDKFAESADKMLENAAKMKVTKVVCVGTAVKSSKEAVAFCQSRKNCFATLAIHPHEAAKKSDKTLESEMAELAKLAGKPKVVGIGETGLDYFYHDDPKTHRRQEKLFRMHIELALKHDLPMSFHIRDPKIKPDGELGSAFKSFFRIIDEYMPDSPKTPASSELPEESISSVSSLAKSSGSLRSDNKTSESLLDNSGQRGSLGKSGKRVRGVVHSFSAGLKELEGSLSRGFYIGLNGIMTFTKDENQLKAAREVPLEKILLETDAPFLTPAPKRAIVCEPKHVRVTAEFLSKIREENLMKFAKITTANAKHLFRI